MTDTYAKAMIMERLADEEALLADGFDRALIGHTQGMNVVAVYDYDLCIDILVKNGEMSIEDAVEHMSFNVVSAYVGEKTPIFVSLTGWL